MGNLSACNCNKYSGDEVNDSDSRELRPECKEDEKKSAVSPFRDSDLDFAVSDSDDYSNPDDSSDPDDFPDPNDTSYPNDTSDSEILRASLIRLREKLMLAVEDEEECTVKSLLDELRRPKTSDIFATSWGSSQHMRNTKFEIWRDAMYIAMEKDTEESEEILNLLLDWHILLWLEDTILLRPILHQFKDCEVDDKMLRLIEVLLKSGKINVNATDEGGYTAVDKCTMEKLVSLLIRYGADVNKRDCAGGTMLMPLFGITESVLRTILIETGTLVALDAMECDGRTVVTFGPKHNILDCVQLLQCLGVSVKVSDHFGYVVDLDAIDGDCPGVLKIAARENRPNAAQLLLYVGASGNLSDYFGTAVDLDAMDGHGRTVLMYAAMYNRPDVVKLLLYAGASVNLSDHFGFTVLHHALYLSSYGETLLGYDHFPRNSEELKKRKEIFKIISGIETSGLLYKWYLHNANPIGQREKIVAMLLERPDIDVNALSFDKFSPMDIAEGWILEIPSPFKDALMEKGAVLNVFQHTESQSDLYFICELALIRLVYPRLTSDFHLDARCRLFLQQLVDDAVRSDSEKNTKALDSLEERLLTLTERFQEQIVSGKDKQGRTALHLAAISFSIILVKMRNVVYLANAIVKKLISLGCSVNATDIYGRTPLHYAHYGLQKLLQSKCADASIKDKDGNTAINETLRSKDGRRSPAKASGIVKAIKARAKKTRLLQTKNERMELNVQYSSDIICSREVETAKSYPRVLWKEGKYAFRHTSVSRITEEVRDLMDAIAKEIGRLDPRFEVRPQFIGSSNEGTRLGKPDEFDFCFVLTKISELWEVSQSPELPTGFVRLKRKQTKVEETSDFDSSFEKDGILNTEKFIWQFSTILSNAMADIESKQSFDWNLGERKSKTIRVSHDKGATGIDHRLKKVSNVTMINPRNLSSVDSISIDIVPCIHIDGWWPDEAISNVSDETKKLGCNMVFDRPQELYPWLPYSESCARISFAKAESDMIKQSCANARQAYMIGKKMIKKGLSRDCGYILKNSLLYCIEALTPTSEKASQLGLNLEEMKSKFHQMDRYLWLKCLLKCHLEFVSQDFCPCYFLPKFSSPIVKTHLKGSYLSLMRGKNDGYAKACKMVYAFYSCTSTDGTESSCQFPAPDPLWERFDRNQLIESLFEIAYK